MSALCAVGHDTPYSAATSDTARFPAAIASADLLPQPLGHPAAGPDRHAGLGERAPRTQRFDAHQAALRHHSSSAAPTPAGP